MLFQTTPAHEELRAKIRAFAEEEIKPLAFLLDQNNEFPDEPVKKMAQLGWLGLPFPKEYGGAGLDILSYAIAVEELARVDGGAGVILSAHVSLGAWPIFAYGTEEQKQKYLVPLAKGEKLGAFGLTEPNAGTDSAAQQMVAALDGDHFVLNGSKCFITNGGYADTFIVFAMTDKSRGNKGISAFIIEKGFKGFSIGKVEHKLGIRASSTTELVFEDCIVPKENLLGDLNKGFKIAMTTLDGGRVGVAAQALGIAEGAFNETIKYMKERIQFGKPLSAFQGLQWMVADMKCEIESSKLLLYRAAMAKDSGKPFSMDAAMAKLRCAETAMDVTTKCVQLHGGYGYSREYPAQFSDKRRIQNMKIIVCIKQVPDTTEVKLDPKTGRLIRDGVPSIINPDDKNALEEALRIKDENPDTTVTVVSMGPPQADVAMREALAMGADEAILISGREFGGSDTWATSYIIATAIKKIPDYDIIFCGRQAIDGDTAQVGPQIAEQLNIPQITYVQKLDIEGDKVIVQRQLEDGYTVVEAKMPVLLTAIKELNTPRYMTPKGIFEAYNKTVQVWGFNDVPVDAEKIGLKGSPTNVNRTFSPEAKGKGIMLEGADKETVKTLIAKLDEKHLL